MSKEISSSRIPARSSSSRHCKSEGNENEFENPLNSIHFPPARTPLNSIQDPSSQIDDSDSNLRSETGRSSRFFSEKKAESTPARSVWKASNYGSSVVACTSGRPPQGGRGGSLSKVSRGISIAAASPWPLVEVPHFELVEDSSFWMDHNVQVLIRIRPISSTERTLQGHGRCLRQESAQTLTWLGHPETRFTFDHIACETISQENLFKAAGLPMVENCMSGYNSCMFAYGQTGSGKTYTMMGELSEIVDGLSGDCGMTPRIFEYLFTRISDEEENRQDEQLKYSCKCSFIEIYNEQITDLLEPSSTNLQLREDMKKGVYVENLKEYEVTTVKDVIKLLLQGAANRKMAATNMNSESSRSHSVFTCVIESRWEKDSMTHFRFGRLNLVDLAGSERQKSSGAEGERLKEAANINKSLSTLGLVIMTLVDVAHGKHRHIPYRDSRLTFLLQDSLGGNSKTTIIANVSPSICSANETLSTLKFAQRAKLIQNNAKVNEDASGDVIALQKQIHQLKVWITFLPENFSSKVKSNLGDYDDERNLFLEGDISDSFNCTTVQIKKMENLEATLVGSLRREKKAQAAVKRLESEIGHMNHLVKQREEDSQRTKMLLRFREEKIRRLELLADGLLSKDEYLMEENVALSEEIQILHMKIDRHPELTRFALENIRLLEQLRMFQDFYEQGERETLLTEVSDLRDQLLYILDGQHAKFFPRITSQAETGFDQAASSAVQEEVEDTVKELEECRNSLRACLETNAKLTREVDDLHSQLENYSTCRKSAFHTVDGSLSSGNDTKEETNKHSSVVPKTSGTDSEDRLASCKEVRDKLLQIQKDHKDAITMQPSDVQKELLDAKHFVEAMESQQIHLIEELDNLRRENKQYWKLLKNKYHDDIHHVIQLETHCELSESDMIKEELDNQDVDQKIECGVEKSVLQTNLESTHNELAEARILNRKYQDDQVSQQLQNHELEQVREEVEVETAKTILHLQGELTALQQEVDSRNVCESSAVRHSLLLRAENQELEKRLFIMSQENIRLTSAFAAKEDEINTLVEEWEKATFDLTSFLVDGCLSLEEASEQIGSIVSLFSQRKNWIGEQVERAVKVFIEKEQTILFLQKRLEEAQKMGMEMQLKLNSLKGATMAISEVQQQEKEENFKEVNQLKTLLSEKMFTIRDLGEKLENKEHQIIEAEKRANATLIALKWLYEMNDVNFGHGSVEKLRMNEPAAESLQMEQFNPG
ncbi:kinesin-like protein KIN-12C isoform X1 [Cinnamomum micranthum f. kanehirae]|uniref:Kinesin-like protein KIN-12C isoform X1 n=1 Tax=Cinnamomum micranthum f. kanehirae TaxID=337451 RepID=A0A3S3R4P3_9MAGN|nr:kinesin-like protein KIN-12C isoform X1 [Cinnamomum micranthum f. kanehirae]